MGLDQSNVIVSRLLKISYCLLFAFPALPNALQTIVFTLFMVTCFIYFFHRKQVVFFESKNYFALFFLSAYYLFFLGTYFYATNCCFSIEYIQPTFLLLICPIVLLFTNWKKNKSLDKLSTIIFTLASFYSIYLLYDYWVEGLSLSYKYYKNDIDFTNYKIVQDWNYIFNQKSEFLDSVSKWGYHKSGKKIETFTHHTFLSAVYNFNIILILANLNKVRGIVMKVGMLGIIVILVCIIYFLHSKINLAFLILAFPMYILYLPLRKKIFNKKFIHYGFSACVVFLSIGYFVIQGFMPFNFDFLNKVSESQRINLYESIINEIKQEPMFGYGANNVATIMDSISRIDSSSFYYNFNIPSYLTDPHSQYLFYSLSGGMIQLVLFVMLLLYLCLVFIAKKNIYGFLFVILIASNCMFEDFLNRTWGVYLFCIGLVFFWNEIFEVKNERNLL